MTGGAVPDYVARVLRQFPSARRSDNGWSANCPAHHDRHPSLSIRIGSDEPHAILLACGVGCDTRTVLAAVGLTFADLWPDGHQGSSPASVLRTFQYTDRDGVVLYE